MAWKWNKEDGYSDKRETFLLDSADDIASPPDAYSDCAAGSVAYTPDLSSIFQKGNDGEWHRIGG